MKQEDFNELFRNRTKELALSVIKITSGMEYSEALGVIRKQLLRSATSVAANFRAVCRARSKKEVFAKLCIVVEEADETLFWMELLIEGEFILEKEMKEIYQEALEILKVMSAYKKKIAINH